MPRCVRKTGLLPGLRLPHVVAECRPGDSFTVRFVPTATSVELFPTSGRPLRGYRPTKHGNAIGPTTTGWAAALIEIFLVSKGCFAVVRRGRGALLLTVPDL